MNDQDEKTQPKNGVFGILREVDFKNDRQLILLVRQKGKKLSLPGGGIESGELVRDSLLREIDEETGIQAIKVRHVGIFKAGHIVFLYDVESWHGEIIQKRNEIEECKFFSIDEIRGRKDEIYPAQFKMIGYFLNYCIGNSDETAYEGILSPGLEREPAWPTEKD